jgi:nicotinate-nucleotide adenylyltransferase
VLGGTFDPVHNGHLAAAIQLLDAAHLAEVWLVPNAHPPHRTIAPDATPQDRLRMVELALDGWPRLRASSVEIDRGGLSYTIDTMRELAGADPGRQFSVLLGYDAALEIRNWHDAEALLADFSFVVFNRPDVAVAAQTIYDLGFVPARTRIVHVDTPAISAHLVRDRLKRGASIDDLVPNPVAAYIAAHALYRP